MLQKRGAAMPAKLSFSNVVIGPVSATLGELPCYHSLERLLRIDCNNKWCLLQLLGN